MPWTSSCPHFDFDYACGLGGHLLQARPDRVGATSSATWSCPRYKRIGKKLHAAGIDLWYTDCDGDVRPLIPDFLEAGINCLFPYEVNSCVHPAELLDEYGNDLRIMGGVDKMELRRDTKPSKYLESLAPWSNAAALSPSATTAAHPTSPRTTTSTTST